MKRFLNVLLALVMVISIIPIATNAEGSTLTYWFWADNDKYAATMREMIADFNATNSRGTVIVGEQIPWDGGAYSNTLLQAAIGGGGPDVATFKLPQRHHL